MHVVNKSSPAMRRTKTGRIYTRLVVLSTLLFVADVIELIRMLPEILHACRWATEEVYGGYEDTLFGELIASAAIQTVNLVIVLLWFYRDSLPDLPQRKRLAHLTQPKHATTISKRRPPAAAPTFNAWETLGLQRRRVPLAVDVLQVASLVVQLLLLGYLQHPIVIVLGLIKLLLNGLVLARSLFSPTALCYSSHRLGRRLHPVTAVNFYARTQRVVWTALGITLFFVAVWILQGMSMVASDNKVFRSAHLRILNDDRHPHNHALVFHEWSNNASVDLQRNALHPRRVVLIVVDGLGDEAMRASATWQDLLRRRRSRLQVHTMEAALPTMSAPNWLTILSGVMPEITGLHGNIFPGETEFDTLFARMARLDSTNAEFARGLTSCTWWSDMIRSHLPRIRGNGVVTAYSMYDVVRRHQPLPYVEWQLTSAEQLVRQPYVLFQESYDSVDGLTDDVTDRWRTHIAVEALNDTSSPYRFFLLHLANVDTQAHYAGVSSAYNRHGTFDEAVRKSAGYVEEVLRAVEAHPWSDRTTVLITADHGEVHPGGHGGTEAILKRIPFLIHRGATATTPADNRDLSIEDVAPTVAALLDIPMPRQVTGSPVVQALDLSVADQRRQARDRYEGRRERLNVFLLQHGTTSRQWCNMHEWPLLQRNATFVRTASVDELDSASRVLASLYAQTRTYLMGAMMARNIGVALLVSFFIVYTFAYMLDRHSLLHLTPMRTTIGPHARHSRSTSTSSSSSSALGISFGMTCGYMLVQFGVLLTAYLVWGYPVWDSTWVHSVGASIRFMVVALAPGSVLAFVLVRAYHVPWMKWANEPLAAEDEAVLSQRGLRHALLCCENAARIVFIETTYARGEYVDLRWVYAMRLYMMLWSILLFALLLIVQGIYAFWFPMLYNNWVLNDTTWIVRFRVATVQTMCLPLLVANLAAMCSFSSRNPMPAMDNTSNTVAGEKEESDSDADKDTPMSHLVVNKLLSLPTHLIAPPAFTAE
jgi:hypothetical protein